MTDKHSEPVFDIMGNICRLLLWSSNQKHIVYFILFFIISGCSTNNVEREINSIIKEVDQKAESIIEQINDPYFFDGKIEFKLDSLSRIIDSMNIAWNDNIEKYRDLLSEKRLNELEETSRDRMERINAIMLNNFPGLRLPFK